MRKEKYTIRGCIGFILVTIIFILAISERADARFIDEMPKPVEVIDCE